MPVSYTEAILLMPKPVCFADSGRRYFSTNKRLTGDGGRSQFRGGSQSGLHQSKACLDVNSMKAVAQRDI